MKYLEYYQKTIKTGKLTKGNGLCDELGKLSLELFEPSEGEKEELIERGLCPVYWGSEKGIDKPKSVCGTKFTPLRQTIVLFLAAMNNEL